MNTENNKKNPAIRPCPVCGKYIFKEPYEDCPVCGWENDVIQEKWLTVGGCANVMSLEECRKAYAEGKEFF